MSTAINNIENNTTKKNTTENDSEWISICPDQDLLANTGLCALHNGEQVAIFKIELPSDSPNIDLEQDLYAISNYDPIGSNVK